jgi:CheY-like chemotaxis protein/anti-sigma regulatory factor (Ser/Thr protein kinase)
MTAARWRDETRSRGLRIEAVLEAGVIPPVLGEASALREVLVNLVLNAVEALPAGGTITLRTWAAGGEVLCAVSDTGAGMPEDVRARALEPFFTTKGPKSTGLGLSVSYRIVQRHGGRLDVASAPGQGTTITLRLPATPLELAPTPPPGRVPSPAATEPLRILVVDDETEVLAVEADMLRAEGHEVLTASSGAEALAVLGGGPAVDLVITDLGMPEMNGWEVARAVRQGWPSVSVGLVTGWGEQPPGSPSDGGLDFVISKPLTLETLADAIARLEPRTPAP